MAVIPDGLDGTLNGVNEVTLCSAPAASSQNIVRQISIHNDDTVSHTITVFKDNNGTNRNIRTIVLAANESWEFGDDDSIIVLSATDQTIKATSDAAATTTEPAFVSSWMEIT